MSSRITIDIGFFFENQHYAQVQGYLPRTEAVKIPELQFQDKEKDLLINADASSNRPSRQVKSDSKRGSDDEMIDEDDVGIDVEMDSQIENQQDDEDIDSERKKEVEEALLEYEDEEEEAGQEFSESYDSGRQDDLEDMGSISSPEQFKHFNNNRTKRQKGDTKDLIQLPDRRPRKGKGVDQASEVVRREEKERKRKQYLKKQIEANQKATIDKILNETGKKLRQREEKQHKEVMQRQHKNFRTLGDIPKIIEINNRGGTLVMINQRELFPLSMTQTPDIKMKEICSKCGEVSKYTLRGGLKYACSLPCYKLLTV